MNDKLKKDKISFNGKEHKIEIEYPEVRLPKVCKWYWMTAIMVFLSGLFLSGFVYKCLVSKCVSSVVNTNQIILLLIIAASLIALCLIVFKAESTKVVYKIEDAKANATLCRKLMEEVGIRNIKLQDKRLSQEPKTQEQSKVVAEVKNRLKFIKTLHSIQDKDSYRTAITTQLEELERILHND